MRATLRPTWPNAWIPNFLPFNSVPDVPLYRFRAIMTVIPNTNSATAFEFCPGVFITQTPLAVAVARSILSYPAPARTTTFNCLAALRTSASIISLRTIKPSTSLTASNNLLFSPYFSSKANSMPALSTTSLIPFTATAANGLSVATNIFMIVSPY